MAELIDFVTAGEEFLLPKRVVQPAVCTVSGCGKKNFSRGLCSMHRARVSLTGTIHERVLPTMAERFSSKVEQVGECSVWVGAKNPHGYGVLVHDNGKIIFAHRVVFELSGIEIPAGRVVDHICRNKACVNITHLRLVTVKQNSENLSHAAQSTNASGVRGVTRMASGRWRARVGHGYKEHVAGYFDTIAEAEAAVIELRNRLHTHNDADRQ